MCMLSITRACGICIFLLDHHKTIQVKILGPIFSQAWGIHVQPSCVLCNQVEETRVHLFVECCFSIDIWANLLRRNLLSSSPGDWDFELDWAGHNWKGKGFRAAAYKLALAATLLSYLHGKKYKDLWAAKL